MIDFVSKESYGVYDLEKLISLLRGESGCPWDREQNHMSIRRNFIEEVYEACEAIDEEDTEHLKEELGDVLLQVLFHTDIERETGNFDLNDVADTVCKKLILRHPHVFGDISVSGTGEVLSNWEEIKRQEKKQDTTYASMDAVAKSLPALWRAEKIQGKAAKVGFDWPDVSGALDKLEEEIAELREAIAEGSGMEEELGDLLFSSVNVSRFLNIDTETALNLSSDKFIRRFAFVETQAREMGKDIKDMSLDEMDKLFDKAKGL